MQANYTHTSNFLDSNGTLSGGQSVNKATVTGSFTAGDKTYDGTNAATVVTRSLTGVIGSDDVSLPGGRGVRPRRWRRALAAGEQPRQFVATHQVSRWYLHRYVAVTL